MLLGTRENRTAKGQETHTFSFCSEGSCQDNTSESFSTARTASRERRGCKMAPEKGIDVEGKVWVSPPALTEMHNVQDMMVGPEGTALQKAALAGDERQVLASLPPSPQSHQLLDFPTCSPARSLARAILGQTLAQDHEQKFQSSSDAETRYDVTGNRAANARRDQRHRQTGCKRAHCLLPSLQVCAPPTSSSLFFPLLPPFLSHVPCKHCRLFSPLLFPFMPSSLFASSHAFLHSKQAAPRFFGLVFFFCCQSVVSC